MVRRAQGHHIGQDIAHISSTVMGGSLKIGDLRFEASLFHGEEPEPTKVNLPLGVPNSLAFRLVNELSADLYAMGSLAYVRHPEPHQPEVDHIFRGSASVYSHSRVSADWSFHNTFILGLVTNYDRAPSLLSFTEEFWLSGGRPRLWGRIELLQRTSAELNIQTPVNPNQGRWVSAFTLGYTHQVLSVSGLSLAVGGSVSKNLLPSEFIGAYGGNPWTGKVFLQLNGMGMWSI